MPLRERKVVAVLPAYNAEKTLQATYDDIPREWVDEILLVDDCSRDRTVELSRELGLKTIVHPKNRGYGGWWLAMLGTIVAGARRQEKEAMNAQL